MGKIPLVHNRSEAVDSLREKKVKALNEYDIYSTTRHAENCRVQRHTVFLFIVFGAVRITSYKFEGLLTKRLLPTVGVQSHVLLHLITFALSLMTFYSYVKDLFRMSRFVVYGLRSKFYKANHDPILTFIALYIYMSIVMKLPLIVYEVRAIILTLI
ncbi:unnamed protein product [Angiostrongylus costaricensis]|uniref:TLC domain-containing protein n=1 Tax=Angiostrongylus costaricensis TaxID=334426 RepID=A0A0R3P9T9_ANGCS|nr:unnamed protein product [Angiostrongylus costaricensis]